MAKMRGGSTVAGKQIVTMDIMNEFIYQIQTSELQDKMRKSENDTVLNDFAIADTYIKDRNKNGIWEISNAANNDNKYNFGTMMNFSNSDSRFQMYAPHKESNSNISSAIYFRTGWGDDIRPWEQVLTKSMLDTGLNLKYDKTGGDITGNILATGLISSREAFQLLDSSNNFVRQRISGSVYGYSSNSTLSEYKFDKDVKTSGEMYAINSNRVWHAGNLNKEDYLTKDTIQLATKTDLNRVLTSSNYTCSTPLNAPSKITGNAYIEVVAYNATNVLQKIYSFDGLHAYSRTLNNSVWTPWKTMRGVLPYMQSISTGTWSKVDGVYEMTITHSLETENITSVIVTDNNKMSMLVGFQTLSSTVIKIFCNSNPEGKVIINAIQ